MTRGVGNLSPESDTRGDGGDSRGPDTRGSETRDRILETARALFAERGFDGATVGAIARRAGIAEGTIYRHFESKEDLFISCLMPALNAFMERSIPQLESARTIEEYFRRVVEMHLSFYEAHLDSANILYSEAPYHPRLMEILGERFLDRKEGLIQHLKALLASGGVRSTRNMAAFLIAFDAGIWAIVSFGDRFHEMYEKAGLSIERETLVDDITDALLYGLIGRPQGDLAE